MPMLTDQLNQGHVLQARLQRVLEDNRSLRDKRAWPIKSP